MGPLFWPHGACISIVYESSIGVYFSGCPVGVGSALGKTGVEVYGCLDCREY